MKKTMLTTLALCGFLLMPTMSHAAQNLTIDLNGQDGKGNSTLILPKTTSNTANLVYQLDLLHKKGPLRLGAAYFLYVALGTPDGRLLFMTTFQGNNSPILPFKRGVIINIGGSIPATRFPATLPLFPISQATVNATPPGTYTFFAVYVDLSFVCPLCSPDELSVVLTIGGVGGVPLSELANHIVSNVAQVSVKIVSKMSKVLVTLSSEAIKAIHIKRPGEPFSSGNRLSYGTPSNPTLYRRRVQFPTLGDGFLAWEAGRNGVVLARKKCLIRFDIPNRVTWTGSKLVCR